MMDNSLAEIIQTIVAFCIDSIKYIAGIWVVICGKDMAMILVPASVVTHQVVWLLGWVVGVPAGRRKEEFKSWAKATAIIAAAAAFALWIIRLLPFEDVILLGLGVYYYYVVRFTIFIVADWWKTRKKHNLTGKKDRCSDGMQLSKRREDNSVI